MKGAVMIISRVFRIVCAAAFISLLVPLRSSAQTDASEDQAKIKVGYLRCEISSGWSYLVGSSRYIECTYTPGTGVIGEYPDHYYGDLGKIGADIGYLSSGVVVWAVLAPSVRLGEGALSGHYVGVSAGATAGVGGGVNFLVGGLRSTISLQPISVEGDVGVGLSVGTVYLDLEPG